MTYGWTGALAVRGHRKRWVRAELAVSSKRTASVRGVPVPQGWLIGAVPRAAGRRRSLGLCPVPLEGAFQGDEP